MNYYKIRESSDPKVTGIKDGMSQAIIDKNGFVNKSNYDKYLDYFLSNDPKIYWEHVGTIPNFEVNLGCIRLEPNAILTDFISYDPNLHHGGKFLVSDRALEILLDHNLGLFKIYNVSIYSDDKHYANYKLLYCPSLSYNVIDFERTLFFTGNKLRGKKTFKINSSEQFEGMKEEGPLFQTEQIVFNNRFNQQLDYFSCKVSLPDIFISDRLKKSLIRENVTGLNIIQAYDPILLFEH